MIPTDLTGANFLLHCICSISKMILNLTHIYNNQLMTQKHLIWLIIDTYIYFSSNVSSFIYDFIYWRPLPFFLNLAKALSILFTYLKEQLFILFNLFLLSFWSPFHYICLDLYYFLPSANFGLSFVPLFLVP